jgi:LPXTG-site transpeptidase (sortase) family protein
MRQRGSGGGRPANRFVGPALAALAALVVIVVAVAVLLWPAAESLPPTESTTTSVASGGTTTSILTHPIEEPVRVVIPAIDSDATIVQVGVEEDDPGSMEVPPFGQAGWFHVGPAPGEPGPSVIVGHVSSRNGPDVFYRLKDLDRGDEILVHDRSGDVATFVVDSTEIVLKTELPTERIWNNTPEPVIRLVTCGGEFDAQTRHYLSNVIAYGHLVE